MELGILSLITTPMVANLPAGLWFNDCGVAMRTLRYDYSEDSKKVYPRLRIDIIRCNGKWYCGVEVMGSTGGMSEPTCLYSPFETFESCLARCATMIQRYIDNGTVKFSRWHKTLATLTVKDFKEYGR